MISHKEALLLLEKEQIKGRLLEHSKKVNEVANYLAKKLKENGINVDLELVDIASLLHDVGKFRSDTSGVPHQVEGANILLENKEKTLARIVEIHSLPDVNKLNSWEEKLIYYADKRCRRDEIVGLKRRLDDFRKRYSEANDLLDKIEQSIFDVEDDIFEVVGRDEIGLEELVEPKTVEGAGSIR